MFGWLNWLLGSKPKKETVIVPPPLPKAQKVVNPATKKADPKVKSARKPKIKKKVVNVSENTTIKSVTTTEIPKKKGRPKKAS